MMDHCDEFSLHQLVESDNNVELVRKLLEKGMDPNLEIGSGTSLLLAAAKSGEDNPEIVRALINAGADVRRKNRDAFTPLHYAVICRKHKVIEILLQTDIDINCQNFIGTTPLHYSIRNPFMCPINDKNLHLKCVDMWIIRKLLDHPNINVNLHTHIGETALVFAIKSNRLDIFKMLLLKNAWVNTHHANNEYTSLHVALSFSDPHVIVALLLKKADVLVMKKRDPRTALDIIINMQPICLAKVYLKVIAFNYNLKEVLESKIQSLELSQLLKRCWNEISRMKGDIIDKNLSVFDFFSKNPVESVFNDPMLQIYKPVIERLVNGVYSEYFCYILNRIPKSKLTTFLKMIINQKYSNFEIDTVISGKSDLTDDFLKIVRLDLLFKYLSCLDIFILIAALKYMGNGESMLDFRNHECYLTDLWDQYSDDHFQQNFDSV